jgi:hypothetical protein
MELFDEPARSFPFFVSEATIIFEPLKLWLKIAKAERLTSHTLSPHRT